MEPVGRLGELVAPAAWGTDFRRLLASSWLSNIGDGLSLAAGPLLVASLTTDPFLVALAATAQWVPPLLFGLLAGGLADRMDRRRQLVGVNAVRTVLLVGLATGVLLDRMTIGLALVLLFAIATAEVFVDTTTQTLLPMLVPRPVLAPANARLQAGFLTGNQLAGPALGAALFAVVAYGPFAAQAGLIAVATLVVARVRLPAVDRSSSPARLHQDIAAGFRWTVRQPAVRTLILTILIFNVTYGAAYSVLVLYATERLGLGPVGFGLLSTVLAVGGVVGTVLYGWITRHLTLGQIMRIGLIIETLSHLVFAVTSSAVVAMIVMFAFGAHAFVWGTTSITIRQAVVPSELQGRVGGVYRTGLFGGLVVGSGIGGVLAQHFGVVAPFWFAFVGSAVFVVAIWRQMPYLDDAGRDDDAHEDRVAGSGS